MIQVLIKSTKINQNLVFLVRVVVIVSRAAGVTRRKVWDPVAAAYGLDWVQATLAVSVALGLQVYRFDLNLMEQVVQFEVSLFTKKLINRIKEIKILANSFHVLYDMVVPAIVMFEHPMKMSMTMPTRLNMLLDMAMIAASLGSTLNFLTRNPPATMPITAPGMATPPVNMLAIDSFIMNWCSMYLGRKVMKPEMIVISKQYANVTIMKTRFESSLTIALGSALISIRKSNQH